MKTKNLKPNPLAAYSVESRWQWFLKNRLRIAGGNKAVSADDMQQLKAIFYVGFGECLDMMVTVGDSEASEDECYLFISRVRREVQDFHLNHAPVAGGRQ